MLKIVILSGAGLLFFLILLAAFLFKKEKCKKNDASAPPETIYPMW